MSAPWEANRELFRIRIERHPRSNFTRAWAALHMNRWSTRYQKRSICSLLGVVVASTVLHASGAFASHTSRTYLLWNANATGADSLDQQSFETTLGSIG